MATSQNGWPVATRDQLDEADLIPGIEVPNGVLAGDVATVFRWLARQYNDRVQRLVPATCWGWNVRPISGSTTYSNHASGTAVDFNAPQLPMGTATARLLSAAQIKAARKIVAESDGVLRWGGEYEDRPDAMHWEIDGTRPQVARLATKIRGEAVTIAWSDKLGKGRTDNDNRTVLNVAEDLENLRNVFWGKPGAAKFPAPAGSVLDLLVQSLGPTGVVERLAELRQEIEDLRTDIASADIERIPWDRVPTSTLLSELARRADS